MDAEHDIRLRLAERIADADWAPPALIRTLSLDDIDIARPVIAASPVLQDADLLAVIARATLEHRIAVAARPDLSPAIVDAAIGTGEAPVLASLASNTRTHLLPDAMARLVEAARRVAALGAPLARRHELSAELAKGLYAWVGETLRQGLCDRFALDPGRMRDALEQATGEAVANRPPRLFTPPVDATEEEGEGRLVAKLEASGQLKPGYLLRVLREGRLSLFEAGLGALGGFSRPQVRAAMTSDGPERLAAACSAVGIDRSAFPTILSFVRSLNGDLPADRPGSADEVAAAFACDRPTAAAAFHGMDRRAAGERA